MSCPFLFLVILTGVFGLIGRYVYVANRMCRYTKSFLPDIEALDCEDHQLPDQEPACAPAIRGYTSAGRLEDHDALCA
tara:strand:+ start:762 stop:995 length:234 start_codon:yes stop_codon:yes gene_type:complete